MYRPRAAPLPRRLCPLQAVPQADTGRPYKQSPCRLVCRDAVPCCQPLHCCAWGLETGSLQFQYREVAVTSGPSVLFRPRWLFLLIGFLSPWWLVHTKGTEVELALTLHCLLHPHFFWVLMSLSFIKSNFILM